MHGERCSKPGSRSRSVPGPILGLLLAILLAGGPGAKFVDAAEGGFTGGATPSRDGSAPRVIGRPMSDRAPAAAGGEGDLLPTSGLDAAGGLRTQSPPGLEQAKAKKSAPRKKAAKSTPRFAFSGSFGLQLIYDDNILRSSDDTILEFRRNARPEKFHTETYDDFIVSPRLNLSLGTRLIGGRATTLRLGLITWQYARNGTKDNHSITTRLRQATFGRDWAEFSYTYAPPGYIRHLSDRPPFTPRTVPIVWLPFKSQRNAFTLAYSHRFGTRVIAVLTGGRVLRYYNRPFMENDNWEWNGTLDLYVTLSRSWRLAGSYMYSDVEARAADTVGETVETSDDGDGSYQRDLYELALRFSPRGKLWLASAVEIRGQYMGYFFTGDKTPWEDVLHTGRKDDVYVIETTVDTVPIWRKVALDLGYRHTERDTSLPASVDEADAEDKQYRNNRVWIGASYPF